MANHADHAPRAPVVGESKSILGGRVLSGLGIAFLAMDAGMKLVGIPEVSETATSLGWTGDIGFWRGMGVLLLALTALYAWPRTALLGAVLLTGYLGGALATHLRAASPFLTHTLFAIGLGAVLWAGLWLRDADLRRAFPLRSKD
jgi:hypothetical protein